MAGTGLYIVEFGCTGNSGRSPMAEVLFDAAVRTNGLEETIGVISSGTRVAPEFDKVWNYAKASHTFTFAERAGLATTPIDEGRYATDDDYRAAINAEGSRLMQLLRPMEAAFRNLALAQKGLSWNGTRTQMTARYDVQLVLTMTEPQRNQADAIYRGGGLSPIISCLPPFVGETGEIENGLGHPTLVPYRRIRDRLSLLMPSVLDKVYELATRDAR